jgi:hypothetical protein
MKENIEEFIRRNRGSFDDKEPRNEVWNSVESALGFHKKTSLWNSVALWRAAAIVFFAISVYTLMPKSDLPKQQVALNEFTDVEQFYIQQISEKTQLIQDFYKMEGLNGFTNDFKQLEAMYQVLKEEMKARPSQKVKDALVLNLLVRIDLLNQQLQKLDTVEEENSNEEEESGAVKATV